MASDPAFDKAIDKLAEDICDEVWDVSDPTWGRGYHEIVRQVTAKYAERDAVVREMAEHIELAKQFIEKEMEIIGPPLHSCGGPDSMCDGDCMAYAHLCQSLTAIKKTQDGYRRVYESEENNDAEK